MIDIETRYRCGRCGAVRETPARRLVDHECGDDMCFCTCGGLLDSEEWAYCDSCKTMKPYYQSFDVYADATMQNFCGDCAVELVNRLDAIMRKEFEPTEYAALDAIVSDGDGLLNTLNAVRKGEHIRDAYKGR